MNTMDETTLQQMQLMRQQQTDILKFNNMDSGSPVNGGYTSEFDGMKIRTATISSPEVSPQDGYEETDPNGHININTGQCSLSWEDTPGGVCRPAFLAGETKSTTEGLSINPEEKTGSGQATTSARESVDISQPCIWTGNDNWCGINYMPPVGSRVITGQGPNGKPQIMGYLPSNYSACNPILSVGETCMKGYGNNYIHCRQSNKIDLKAWGGSGDIDPDDPNQSKSSSSDSTVWVRLNANDGYLKLSVGGGSNSSAIMMTNDVITITTGTYNLQVRNLINIDSPKITQN
jgi:hypothetical protein